MWYKIIVNDVNISREQGSLPSPDRGTPDRMKRHHIVMNVDFFDEIGLHGDSMGPEDVEELVGRCREAGVDAVFWRAAGLGVAGYPSRLLATNAWLAQADRAAVLARTPGARTRRPPQSGRFRTRSPLDATLARMDPVAVAREACRKAGLGFHVWLDLFDEQNGRFLIEHPECQVTGRDGVTRWPGLRSYANAAAVAERLAVIDELAAYEPDGFYFSTSCHSRHLEFPEPDDAFGFEPEVAEAYRRETGRDLASLATPEEAAVWHRIKGDAFTEFLRRAKALLRPAGMRLAVGTQFGAHTELACPYMSSSVKYRFETQWKRWIDEGIADALILGDYEWPWDRVPTWEPKGFQPPPGRQVADVLTPEYVAYAAGRVGLLLFSSWLSAYAQHHQGASAGTLDEAMRMRARTILETGADGICLHEAHTFEYYQGFDSIGEMRRTLDASARG